MNSLAVLRSSRDALAHYVLSQLGADGSIRGRCRSRRLESALFLALLKQENAAPDMQARLTRYLLDSSHSNPLDALLAASVHSRPNDRAEQFISSFDHLTGMRKKILLQTLFEILGLIRHSIDTRPVDEHFPETRTPAGELMLTAIKILRARGDRQHCIHLVQQLERGSTQTIWEGYTLAHLVALHAVAAIHPGHPLIARGIRAISSVQNADGGIPAMVGHDVFFTALGGQALAALEIDPQATRAMQEFVSCHQNENGGWPYTEKTRQTDVDTTSWCLSLLRAAPDATYATQINASEKYLEQIADPAGGFPTYLPGHRPEAEMTANAIMALTPPRRPLTSSLSKAIEFLIGSQTDEGAWPENWATSEPLLICQATLALRSGEGAPIQQAIDYACHRLIKTQRPDGGWGTNPASPSDPNSTSNAVAALITHRPKEQGVMRTATEWLAERQNADGSFDGPSDQVGPRPFRYNFPILTNLRVLSALSRGLGKAP
ncbi:prenyltransferase/squalene oxidase repeat-containing protein [Streptomyces sp. R28]|uniref:Prenyltransferase/squalene oxidase repeat-containing protein n=1 Tax=Streptomyces sp. R28 TaxID=3238628 RepID=A0AB39PN60_9ACTN